MLLSLLDDQCQDVFLASISGEWDIKRPFPEKEFRELAQKRKLHLRVLLAHPESEGLIRRGTKEIGQNLHLLKKRIIENTRYYQGLQDNVDCEVRWYLGPPTFHVFGSEKLLYFSPFVDGTAGHDEKRYKVSEESHLFTAFRCWFDDSWARSLNPETELPWAEQEIARRYAVFLDRDGTLIEDLSYHGSPRSAQIELLPGVVEGLQRLVNYNFRLIVVSNQESVGIKLTDPTDLNVLTKRVKDKFKVHGIHFDAFYFCTHSRAEQCSCRKPKGGLFERAKRDFRLDLSKCHFIGDSEQDAEVKTALNELCIHRVGGGKSFLDVISEILEEVVS